MLDDLAFYPGNPDPLGFSTRGSLANFAVFSRHASKVTLGLRTGGERKEIALNRTGDVWHIGIERWIEGMEYAYRLEGAADAAKGYLFDPHFWLADPAAEFPSTPLQWGIKEKNVWSRCTAKKPFDWQGVPRPRIPLSELVIYEMHIRGFTRHSSSSVSHPGTYLGMIEKIPYLRKLGVNALELMPIFEFDETHCKNLDPNTGAPLVNYWGYNPLCLFAPMRRFAVSDAHLEFKTLVRELHRSGIEVILDVVYNHTGEGKEKDYRFSFRGLDNAVYYMVDEHGNYRDFTGCGNTFNSNHPAVMQLILGSLHYWAQEMQVDGFRFDLAAIHTRGPDGKVMTHPPLLEAIAADPVLRETKLIAEGWDAAGLYMVESFPDFGSRFASWSMWNGKFRDRARQFIKGTDGWAGKFADVLSGSEFLFHKHSPLTSVNFITAHDGFSLSDLVSYNQKHNLGNGETGRDGNSQNFSWNCGAEGATDAADINALRERQQRNFLLALFLAQGIPMLLMGDEYGHTRHGNNNPYVQDNEINWFLWDVLEKRPEVFDFVSSLIAFRKAHPCLRLARFLTDADVAWHGTEPGKPDWSSHRRFVAYTLNSEPPLYIAFNADSQPVRIALPVGQWTEVVRTDRSWDQHNFRNLKQGPLLPPSLELPPHSSVVLIPFH